MDKSKILKFYDYREPKPHYLIENITELTNKILAQINTVIIPFSEKLQSIHYLDSVVNKSIEEFGILNSGDYGTVWLKKMIIARLAKNIDFEKLTEFAKSKFIEGTTNIDEERANNWKIALSHFDEMYERIKKL